MKRGKAIANPYGGTTIMKAGKMKGRSIASPYGGKIHRKHKPALVKKLNKMMTCTNAKTTGGFIFPLVGHIIKAVRSNNEHKKRLKQQAYEKSEQGKQDNLKRKYEEGKREKEETEAYNKGLSGGKTRRKKI